jgi:hypothetical protein
MKRRVEVKHGQGLRHAVLLRRDELERSLAELQNSPQQGSAAPQAIESALATLDALLPGKLDQISPVVASHLAQWLEHNKYLGILDAKRRRVHLGARS